ncbi:MAG: hypothetical protein ACRDTE_21435 [Pseudonocardiaceae bacterium]
MWAALVAECVEQGVNIGVNGRVYDLTDPDDAFMLDLSAMLARKALRHTTDQHGYAANLSTYARQASTGTIPTAGRSSTSATGSASGRQHERTPEACLWGPPGARCHPADARRRASFALALP